MSLFAPCSLCLSLLPRCVPLFPLCVFLECLFLFYLPTFLPTNLPTYLPTYLLSISIIVYTLSLSIDVGVYATICIFLCLSFGRKRSYAKHKNCFSTISWKPQKCFQTNFQSENLSDKFSNLQMSTYDARKLRKMICSILCPISNQNSPNQVQNLWEIFSRRRLGSNRPKW